MNKKFVYNTNPLLSYKPIGRKNPFEQEEENKGVPYKQTQDTYNQASTSKNTSSQYVYASTGTAPASVTTKTPQTNTAIPSSQTITAENVGVKATTTTPKQTPSSATNVTTANVPKATPPKETTSSFSQVKPTQETVSDTGNQNTYQDAGNKPRQTDGSKSLPAARITTVRPGQQAIYTLGAALSTKYAPEEYQGLLSKVTPEKIEENLPVADSVIKKNIDSGRVSADYDKKHPYMRYGLAVTYSDDGNFTKNDYKMLNDVKYMQSGSQNDSTTKLSSSIDDDNSKKQSSYNYDSIKGDENITGSSFLFTDKTNSFSKKNDTTKSNPQFKNIPSFPTKSLIYENESYSIHIPTNEEQASSDGWKTIDSFTLDSGTKFDALGAFLGFELDDMNGTLDVTNSNVNNQQIKTAGIASLSRGLLNSISSGISKDFVTLSFQKKSDENRVIIKIGSLDTLKFHNEKATGESFSCLSGLSAADRVAFSNKQKEMYEKATGISSNWYDTYDIRVTLDSKRKNSPYYYYVGITPNGNYIMTPIVYANDKLQLVKVSPNAKSGYIPLINLSPQSISFLDPKYKNIINNTFKELNISEK